MKKLFLIALTLSSLISPTLKALDGFDGDIQVGAGYALDSLKVHSNVGGVDFVRKWNDINLGTISATLEGVTCQSIYLRLEGEGGWGSANERFSDGSVTTSADGWDFPVPRVPIPVVSAVDNKNASSWDWDFAFGYQFCFCSCCCCGQKKYYFTPLVGFGSHQLRFQSLYAGAVSRSHFRINWSGFLIGFKAGWIIDCNWSTYIGYEWQPARFHSNYNEDLGTGTIFYSQKSTRGNGNFLYLGVDYALPCNFYLGGELDFRYYTADRGYVNSQGATGPLYNARWSSFGIQAILGYYF